MGWMLVGGLLGGIKSGWRSGCQGWWVGVQVFNYTGETGTYRYMAPEVFRHEPYNGKADVRPCR